MQTNVLKEDIVLKSASAPNMFTFDVNLQNLTLVETDGDIVFRNTKGDIIFQLAPMYMEDANGKRSESVFYTVQTGAQKGEYRITLTVDSDFLNAAYTVFPVIVDPSVMITGSSETFDTCVDQQYPTSNYYLRENLWTGGALGTNAMRTYIKFNLPTNISSSQITSAYLRIKKREFATPTVKAYRVTSNWSSSAITWNNKPGYTTTGATGTISLDTGAWYKINVTTMVKNWRSGTYSNYGFMLKEPSESNTNQKTKFYSSDAPSPNKPELIINYTSTSSPYYGTRPYQSTSRSDINCMGYALEYPEYISGTKLNISQSDMVGKTNAQLLSYIAAKAQTWMTSKFGAANFGAISSYNSNINTEWYRVILRVGFVDSDGDNVYDANENFDYHWWYQTSNGNWADKLGGTPSQYRSGTAGQNPASLTWKNGSLYYNSSGRFYQIKDIRSVSW